MLRYFYGTALSVILTSLITEAAFSRPLFISQEPDILNSGVRDSNVDIPLCYMQTADGRIVNLQQLCSSGSQGSSTSTSLSEGFSKTRSLRIRSGYAEDNKGGEEDTRSD